MYTRYRYIVVPFLIVAGIGQTVLIALSAWSLSKISEYGYCYSPYILTSHVTETFIVGFFLLQVWYVHFRLAEYIGNPMFMLVLEKRRLLWI